MMFFKKTFFGGKLEKEVLDLIEEHLKILMNACETFKLAFEISDTSLIKGICKLEDDGDRIRREIALRIHEGAFLPYLRPNIYRFAEVVDEAIDKLEDTVYDYLNLKSCKILDLVKDDILKIAELNFEASKYLSKAYDALLKGEDLREITTKIRFYEREIDSIKNIIKAEMKEVDVNVWEALTFVSFLEHIVSVSDLIEDAGDIIQMINVSLR